jgi:hypothetical protein
MNIKPMDVVIIDQKAIESIPAYYISFYVSLPRLYDVGTVLRVYGEGGHITHAIVGFRPLQEIVFSIETLIKVVDE